MARRGQARRGGARRGEVNSSISNGGKNMSDIEKSIINAIGKSLNPIFQSVIENAYYPVRALKIDVEPTHPDTPRVMSIRHQVCKKIQEYVRSKIRGVKGIKLGSLVIFVNENTYNEMENSYLESGTPLIKSIVDDNPWTHSTRQPLMVALEVSEERK